jgi:hypothetical protein
MRLFNPILKIYKSTGYYFHILFWNCSDIVIFFVFKSLIGIIQYKRLNKLQNVAVIYINIKIHIDRKTTMYFFSLQNMPEHEIV